MNWFNNLPDKAQTAVTIWRQDNTEKYEELFSNHQLTTLSPKQIVSLLLICNIVKRSLEFKAGNTILSERAVKRGYFPVFVANNDDVETYSNQCFYYYVFEATYKLY